MILLDHYRYATGSNRVLPQWQRMLHWLGLRKEQMRSRFLANGLAATKPFQFVNSLLGLISGPYLLEDRPMMDIYNEHILGEAYVISKTFDPMIMGSSHREWIINGSGTEEVFVPTYGIIKPADGVWVDDSWEKWQSVVPLRLLDHDSRELDLEFVGGHVSFTKNPPTYAVIGIDVPALFVKWLKYIKATGTTFETADRNDFIKNHVLQYLYDDVVTIWITKLIAEAVTLKISDQRIDELAKESANAYLYEATVKQALQELTSVSSMLANNNIRMHDFLAIQFYPDGVSLGDVMYDHNTTRAIENNGRYRGYDIIKSLSVLSAVTDAMLMQSTYLNRNIVRLAQQEFSMLSRSNWRTHVRSKTVVKAVDTYLINLAALLS